MTRSHPTEARRILPRGIAAGLALALAAAPAAMIPAQAVAQEPAQSQQPQVEPAQNVSAEDVEAFALAALELRDIVRDVERKMTDAPTDAARDDLRADGSRRMVEAVQAEGLSVDEYNAIAVRAREDRAFAERLDARIRELDAN